MQPYVRSKPNSANTNIATVLNIILHCTAEKLRLPLSSTRGESLKWNIYAYTLVPAEELNVFTFFFFFFVAISPDARRRSPYTRRQGQNPRGNTYCVHTTYTYPLLTRAHRNILVFIKILSAEGEKLGISRIVYLQIGERPTPYLNRSVIPTEPVSFKFYPITRGRTLLFEYFPLFFHSFFRRVRRQIYPEGAKHLRFVDKA